MMVMKERDKILEVPKEYWPQAVVDWHNKGIQYDYKSKYTTSELKDKARKHLSAMGWRFWYINKGNNKLELRYDSPNGKTYLSLRTACTACIHQGGVSESVASNTTFSDNYNNDVSTSNPKETIRLSQKVQSPLVSPKAATNVVQEHSETPSRKSVSRKRSAESSSSCSSTPKRSKKLKKMRNIIDLEQQAESKEFENHPISSSSLKKPKVAEDLKKLTRDENEEPGSSKKNIPARILCWLIDNNIVVPGAKVQYRSRKATGKITRQGIQCDCCSDVFKLSEFEKHAGSTNHRPAANIILVDDGRSLMDCKVQLMKNSTQPIRSTTTIRNMEQKDDQQICGSTSDDICSVCHYQGELIICDRCPSTFHPNCVGLSEVPDDEWICPSCCCGVCGECVEDLLICHQCELKYHTGCVKDNARIVNFQGRQSKGDWFCSRECENVCLGLKKILGKSLPVGGDKKLTWTLLKSKNSSNASLKSSEKLNMALKVIHECFEPCKDPYNNRDVAEDVVFNNESDLRRLNFKGFYMVVLEKGDDLVTVATVRIYGERLAEVPLVATRFQYRRLGMCRVLMNELEKQLSVLGVEKLTLPAIATTLETWINRFGFSKMTLAERSQLLKYTFLDFPDTVMCQKFLKKSTSSTPSWSDTISVITQAEEQRGREWCCGPIPQGILANRECTVGEASNGYFRIPKQMKIPALRT
ncbi:hypothetical protein FEM48_Zijuj06G0042800 [Ziziphus jujuba var. spinosa]|uniref:Increased DNA methylation 1 n=1 Tax=Ziziphus jujuba var. spinosa TaxID=714518 RepID=A0A978V745_ZIZJJ|nr:hypothetical protein FEM48_Zijuj06G0042800 [Ziziphus jujuba var. spinosa]